VRREIEKVRRERRTRQVGRKRAATPIVALVGYTNAGKSTLFNSLTRAAAVASDQLFVTLDPLVRKARLGPGCDVLLVDTVGFIQKLPHTLVDAFRATLEEVCEADLLMHVVDASAEDVEEREAAVELVLRQIGAAEQPRLVVLNKADRVPEPRSAALLATRPGSVAVSALRGEGLDRLRHELLERLELASQTVWLRFAATDTRGIARVYAAGRVLAHQAGGAEVKIQVELPERLLARYREHLA
jgi:GTP-binding protein HflX